MSKAKRGKGQFYTQKGNPFELTPFLEWVMEIDNFSDIDILEPFAGQNNIPKYLNESGLTTNKFVCYDIEPKESVLSGTTVEQRDTIADFPTGYTLTITNPPFLSKSSAARHHLDYPRECPYDDIYKLCLDKMLKNVSFVASIVPESFITSGEFTDRLHTYISLTNDYFTDTEAPVGLALFNDKPTNDFQFYRDETLINNYSEISKYDINQNYDNILNIKVIFNDPHGKLGLIAIDSSAEKKIRFINGADIRPEKIKHYSRMYSRITIESSLIKDIPMEEIIIECNNILTDYRIKTYDVFLTSFKSKNKDGLYRRRMDWKTAKSIINAAINNFIRKNLVKNKFKTHY